MARAGKTGGSSEERRFYLLIAGLALVGLAFASYLTYLDYSRAQVTFCEVGSGCDTVRESEYVTLLSVPVALLGIVGYLAIISVALGPFSSRFKKASLAAMATIGFVFSAYLTYLELFVIHAICPYCVASACTLTAIFLLLLLRRPVVPGVPGPRVAFLGAALAGCVILATVFLPKEITASPSPQPTPTTTPAATQTPTPESPDEKEFQVGLAKHLQAIGAVMYGSDLCHWCQVQRELFGDAIEYIEEVYCSGPPEVNPQPRVCWEKDIRVTPTWEINGRFYTGARSLEELAELSGYPGPLPSSSSSP